MQSKKQPGKSNINPQKRTISGHKTPSKILLKNNETTNLSKQGKEMAADKRMQTTFCLSNNKKAGAFLHPAP